jgi:hypothetical protein
MPSEDHEKHPSEKEVAQPQAENLLAEESMMPQSPTPPSEHRDTAIQAARKKSAERLAVQRKRSAQRRGSLLDMSRRTVEKRPSYRVFEQGVTQVLKGEGGLDVASEGSEESDCENDPQLEAVAGGREVSRRPSHNTIENYSRRVEVYAAEVELYDVEIKRKQFIDSIFTYLFLSEKEEIKALEHICLYYPQEGEETRSIFLQNILKKGNAGPMGIFSAKSRVAFLAWLNSPDPEENARLKIIFQLADIAREKVLGSCGEVEHIPEEEQLFPAEESANIFEDFSEDVGSFLELLNQRVNVAEVFDEEERQYLSRAHVQKTMAEFAQRYCEILSKDGDETRLCNTIDRETTLFIEDSFPNLSFSASFKRRIVQDNINYSSLHQITCVIGLLSLIGLGISLSFKAWLVASVSLLSLCMCKMFWQRKTIGVSEVIEGYVGSLAASESSSIPLVFSGLAQEMRAEIFLTFPFYWQQDDPIWKVIHQWKLEILAAGGQAKVEQLIQSIRQRLQGNQLFFPRSAVVLEQLLANPLAQNRLAIYAIFKGYNNYLQISARACMEAEVEDGKDGMAVIFPDIVKQEQQVECLAIQHQTLEIINQWEKSGEVDVSKIDSLDLVKKIADLQVQMRSASVMHQTIILEGWLRSEIKKTIPNLQMRSLHMKKPLLLGLSFLLGLGLVWLLGSKGVPIFGMATFIYWRCSFSRLRWEGMPVASGSIMDGVAADMGSIASLKSRSENQKQHCPSLDCSQDSSSCASTQSLG